MAAGTIEASSERMAEDALYQAGFKYVLDLQSKSPPLSIHRLLPSLLGVKTGDIIDFSRQLAAFIESGSSLHTALELLEEQAGKPALKEVISGIIDQLEEGTSFSQAIESYANIFPHSYRQVIQSSEKVGELEVGLKQIADYLENRAAIMDKIRRALAYPIFVICLAIGVVVLLVTTVLPPILKLFSSFQADLPKITLIAIAIVNFFSSYKVHLMVGLLLIIALLVLGSRIPEGRLVLDRLVLRLPVIGALVVQHQLGLFCRTSSMLLAAGLPLPDILEVATRSASHNRVVMRSLTILREKLMQGEGLARPMSEDKLFPPMMLRMINVGEQTGTLESALETLAAYYERHTGKTIQSLIATIEPALTIAIGIGIAFVMYSMVIPIYSIMGKVH